jgi:hypothetical protein
MGMEGRLRGLTDVLSRYLLRGTDKNHKKLRIVDDPEVKKGKNGKAIPVTGCEGP